MDESPLFARLAEDVAQWRKVGYTCDDHPFIGEILAWQMETQADNPSLKFLREPQFSALEVYWYVRLVLKTPHVIDLYKHYYEDDKRGFFDALGVPILTDTLEFAKIDEVLKRVAEDKDYVARQKNSGVA